ncbi:MAG: fumarate hydratase C-terminal domain-containing protein, partial [bacterium]
MNGITKKISTPLTAEVVKSLRAGDAVEITGLIYTARDLAHQRLIETLKRGANLPFNIIGAVIYYVGPCPAKPGRVIGSCGPTTSYR